MNKFICIIIFLLSSSVCGYSQTSSEFDKDYKEARDSGSANYVIFTDAKGKKEIKSISFPNDLTHLGGKVTLADGEKIKYKPGEVKECQTEEAFYKLCKYAIVNPAFGYQPSTFMGFGLAKRQSVGKINIYILRLFYQPIDVLGKKGNEIPLLDKIYFYLVENSNDGNLIPLSSEKDKVLDIISGWVSKSKNANLLIEEYRKKYKNLQAPAKREEQTALINAVKAYNQDFALGVLEK